MTYEERLNTLIDSMKNSKLNNEEFNMMYGILELSRSRNAFDKQYNAKIDEIINKRESVE